MLSHPFSLRLQFRRRRRHRQSCKAMLSFPIRVLRRLLLPRRLRMYRSPRFLLNLLMVFYLRNLCNLRNMCNRHNLQLPNRPCARTQLTV